MALIARKKSTPQPMQPIKLSPERERLGEAIAEAQAHDQRVAATSEAIEREDRRFLDLLLRVEDAEQDVEAAKGAMAEQSVADVMGEVYEPVKTMHQARADLTQATEDLAAARANRDALRRKLDDLKQSPWVYDRLKLAALAVLRSEVSDHAAELTGELASLQRRMYLVARTLDFFVSNKIVAVNEEIGIGVHGRALDPELRSLMVDMQNRPRQWWRVNEDPFLDAAAIWDAYLERLKRNPHEPLPIDVPNAA